MKQAVVNHIRQHYKTWELSGWVISRIALEMECSQATIYRAIAFLKANGEIVDKVYTGRLYVEPEEIIEFLGEGIHLISTPLMDKLKDALHADSEAIWYSTDQAIRYRWIERVPSGYGLTIRVGKQQ